jgi:hypothetical protein
MVLPIRFRQKGSGDSSWAILRPGSSSSFNWEDLLQERMVEVIVDGAGPSTIRSYGLDQVAEYPPLASTRGPVAALHASVYREGASMVLRVEDWKPSTGMVERAPISKVLLDNFLFFVAVDLTNSGVGGPATRGFTQGRSDCEIGTPP